MDLADVCPAEFEDNDAIVAKLDEGGKGLPSVPSSLYNSKLLSETVSHERTLCR